MAEVLQENYTYEDILTLIKSIYGLVQAACRWFKEYTQTITLKVRFKQCNTDPCLLYRVNELGTETCIVYIDDTLVIGYKPVFMDKIECIKK